ncbi:MAG TPA: FAD-dependent monooxygenase, partial [Acidimicrobiales bacterium]|nr:FAD-dependent monooxygenase [Acidimicrobiales bacterium]
VLFSPKGRRTQLPLPDKQGQFAAVVPRLELDVELLKLAESSGVHLETPVSFSGITQHEDYVSITTTNGRTLHGRYVIAADGMWSSVRKAVGGGIKGYRGDWHAFRQYFSNTGSDAQHLTVWFEPDLLPGYVWLFPLPGQRANFGFGILRDHSHRIQEMGRLWRDILNRPRIRSVLGEGAVPEGTHKAWPIPTRMKNLEPSKGRVIFVGDAMGVADPMTGEGIAQALHTGRLAAASIIQSGPFESHKAQHIYKNSIAVTLGHDHRFAERLQSLLIRPETTELALKFAGMSNWTRKNFARWMFEDYPRGLILTPNRWKRGMFNQEGAYQGDRMEESSISKQMIFAEE